MSTVYIVYDAVDCTPPVCYVSINPYTRFHDCKRTRSFTACTSQSLMIFIYHLVNCLMLCTYLRIYVTYIQDQKHYVCMYMYIYTYVCVHCYFMLCPSVFTKMYPQWSAVVGTKHHTNNYVYWPPLRNHWNTNYVQCLVLLATPRPPACKILDTLIWPPLSWIWAHDCI